MSDLYADASALVKLVVREDESSELKAALGDRTVASSAIVRVELTRAVRVRNPGGEVVLWHLLRKVELIPPSHATLALAAKLANERLRSLDAIHLASALVVGAARMLVYDRRLAEAAVRNGIEVLAPGR